MIEFKMFASNTNETKNKNINQQFGVATFMALFINAMATSASFSRKEYTDKCFLPFCATKANITVISEYI